MNPVSSLNTPKVQPINDRSIFWLKILLGISITGSIGSYIHDQYFQPNPLAEMKEIIGKFDKNKDGSLNLDERRAARKHYSGIINALDSLKN